MGQDARRAHVAGKVEADGRLPLLHDAAHEFVHQVRMGAVMAARRALSEGFFGLRGVVLPLRQGKAADLLGQIQTDLPCLPIRRYMAPEWMEEE